MNILSNELTPFLLRMYLKKYGLNFFNKLNKYKTCSVLVRDGELDKKIYFRIDKIDEIMQIDISLGDEKYTVNWFDCWDFNL